MAPVAFHSFAFFVLTNTFFKQYNSIIYVQTFYNIHSNSRTIPGFCSCICPVRVQARIYCDLARRYDQGVIDNMAELKNNRQVKFKKSAAEGTTYASKDILGFGYTQGKIFESKKIVSADSLQSGLTFMELMQGGNLSFYFCQEDTRFYVQKKEGQLYPLYQTEKIVKNNGVSYLQVRKNYIGILNLVMEDCANTRKNIENVKLEYNSLLKLISRYNTCGCSTKIVNPAGKRAVLTGGVLMGMQLAGGNFDPRNNAYNYLVTFQYDNPVQPFRGLFI
jgi:hypothetical protein